MMGYWGYGGGMGVMGWWWLVWLAIIVGAVWVGARFLGGTRTRTTTDESPETILKRRYARGEIDREEFERRLNDIRR
jgi:putative membrane protein